MIDVHCHLEYMEDADKVLRGLKERGMKIITAAASPEFLQVALNYSENNPEVFASLGLHPFKAAKLSEKELKEHMKFISDSKNEIVAVGEIGLDYKTVEVADVEKTKRAFLKMIELANKLSLPVVIHSRNSTGDCLEILKSAKVPVVFHNFSGNMTEFNEAVARGYYISIGTNLAGSKNMKKAATRVPIGQLLLETDSPWNDPFTQDNKKLTNVPWNIEYSAEFIAKLRETTKEEILQKTEENAVKLFGLSK